MKNRYLNWNEFFNVWHSEQLKISNNFWFKFYSVDQMFSFLNTEAEPAKNLYVFIKYSSICVYGIAFVKTYHNRSAHIRNFKSGKLKKNKEIFTQNHQLNISKNTATNFIMFGIFRFLCFLLFFFLFLSYISVNL